MSVASSPTFPCFKNQNYPSCSSSSSSYTLRFSTTNSTILTIRNSQAEGSIRRPVAPSPPKPNVPPPTQSTTTTTSAPPKPVAVTTSEGKNVITLEFQRQKAKELQAYFKQKKLEEANQGPFFGFIAKNEISNGR